MPFDDRVVLEKAVVVPVLLPAPRKPESTVTGSGPVPPDARTTCTASRTAVYGDGVRGRLRQRKRIAAGLAVALRLIGFTLTVPKPSGPCTSSCHRAPSGVRLEICQGRFVVG